MTVQTRIDLLPVERAFAGMAQDFADACQETFDDPVWAWPATISPYLIRAIGARAAHRYFLTAERFGAAEAHRLGLVHAAVPADQLDAQVAELVGALTTNSPNAVRECKALVQHVAGRDITRLLIDHTVEGIADIRASDEGKEGVQSFLQKRKPGWL